MQFNENSTNNLSYGEVYTREWDEKCSSEVRIWLILYSEDEM